MEGLSRGRKLKGKVGAGNGRAWWSGEWKG